MNLLTLSNDQLQTLIAEADRERRRRESMPTNDFSAIRSNEVAKRALSIAIAGGHSITLFGAPSTGKTMLRAAAYAIAPDLVCFECHPCPCGNRNNVFRECPCTGEDVRKHLKTFPASVMVVEVCQPTLREIESRLPGTSTAEIVERIETASRFLKSAQFTTSRDAETILRAAVSDMGLTPEDRQNALAVSKTIAAMIESTTIDPSHICEAINYTRRIG